MPKETNTEDWDRKTDRDYERRVERWRKREKRSEDLTTVEGVLDLPTRQILYKLINSGIIGEFGGALSTGKESTVFHAFAGPRLEADELAIKVYRTRTLDFRRIQQYIFGDPRFSARKRKSHKLMELWAEKEFKNLMRFQEAGVSVPRPFVVKKNVIIMELLGKDGIAAPLLKDTELELPENYEAVMKAIIEDITKAFQEAKLVHADLSEYNILYWKERAWFIDVGQAVLLSHPLALNFLFRDIQNVVYLFKPLDKARIETEEIFTRITGKTPPPQIT
ncbi:MAG: serine protein kinase RIO [Candidatus Heimdallarchaeota archaeon]